MDQNARVGCGESSTREGEPVSETLSDRVLELRAWATSRIQFCKDLSSDDLGPAAQERRTLEAILRILDGTPTPIATADF